MDLRVIFESMHPGRDLTRHHLRGTYIKPQIAALWNQHVRTWRMAKATAEKQIAEFDSNDFGYITDVDRLVEDILDVELTPPTDTVSVPTIHETELAALLSFYESCSNGVDYDVPIAMMKVLADIGLVNHGEFDYYELTQYGRAIVAQHMPEVGK